LNFEYNLIGKHVEDFFSAHYGFGQKPVAGKQETQNAPGSSNPFAFPRPGGAGGPPPSTQRKLGAPPQARFPQQRFTAGAFFNQAPPSVTD
jgi:hypothetical protein